MSEARALPLTALRVLDAYIRHRNFTRAAEELGITPGAVTQHIRALEEWTGAPLFTRSGREFLPTANLRNALPDLREGFARLADAGRVLRAATHQAQVVSVSAPPSFASKWLLPQLDDFRSVHPDIEIWVSADLALVDFSRSNVDLAIRYGPGTYDGLIAERLFVENVVPVASPAYLAQAGPLEHPADLLRCRLLHDLDEDGGGPAPDWTMWFRTRGVAADALLEGPRYNQSSLVVEQAVAGKGIALARAAIAERDLGSGRLEAVLPDVTELNLAYWLVWPRHRSLSPPARAFVSWLSGRTIAVDQRGCAAELSGS
ncbi:LysR substrate-binding domain-containing protein [Novosphingobium sp. KCTC 2891]|uniref:LysR substrate-binding domain-containing protein n=1 Tax=Novosphingobium sp. KCTC 2891 TaxID=2989730 RepID=UPI0022239C34|nr:LysR substrate-binding domain-containing protein [Novosphingobium sp. KCTC 2891]MCW1384081.1 LysR substrate-binding domain-containing protein [Novosphingobium sp. KCTC 2891]